MDIRTIIKESNPEIKEWSQSKHYHYSRKLMQVRYANSLNCIQMSKLLNLAFDEYITLEYGDYDVDLKDYDKIFKLLKDKGMSGFDR